MFAACRGWRSLEPPFQRAIAHHQPERVRVTLADSTRIELREPVVEADSLFGRDGENERVAVAAEQIVAADQRVTDVASTAVLLLLAGGLLSWLIWGYCCTGT
jgi:IS4 transposase